MADITPLTMKLLPGSTNVITGRLNAGALLTIGVPVVTLNADNEWVPLDTSSLLGGAAIGILRVDTSAGSLAEVITSGRVDFGVALTAGDYLFASDNPGAIAPLADVSSGRVLVQLGQVVDANHFAIAPRTLGVQKP